MRYFRKLWVGCLVLAIIVLGDDAWRVINANAESVLALQRINTHSVSYASKCPRVAQSGEPSFPSLIDCLLLRESDLGDQSKTELQQLSAFFPQRTELLSAFQARIAADNGNYEQVCALSAQMDSRLWLLRFAKYAQENADLAGVDAYLDCIERMGDRRDIVPPHEVAILHYTLGQHFARTNKAGQAEEQFELAIRWYPVLWADPVIAWAGLKAEQGDLAAAVQIVTAALPRALLPESLFPLCRQLGFYEEELGHWDSAYCAYLKAERIAGQLTESYVPESWYQDLRARIAKLAAKQPLTATDCSSLWTTWSISR